MQESQSKHDNEDWDKLGKVSSWRLIYFLLSNSRDEADNPPGIFILFIESRGSWAGEADRLTEFEANESLVIMKWDEIESKNEKRLKSKSCPKYLVPEL